MVFDGLPTCPYRKPTACSTSCPPSFCFLVGNRNKMELAPPFDMCCPTSRQSIAHPVAHTVHGSPLWLLCSPQSKSIYLLRCERHKGRNISIILWSLVREVLSMVDIYWRQHREHLITRMAIMTWMTFDLGRGHILVIYIIMILSYNSFLEFALKEYYEIVEK